MKIIVLTVLDPNERPNDVFVGTSAYTSVEAVRTTLIADWANERDHDLGFETDPAERDAIRLLYNERITDFDEWARNESFIAEPNGSWWSDGEGLTYEFRLVEVV